MIEFAINNNNRPNITYLVQDFSIEWDKLRPELRELEGKVDMIFSNYTFQWLEYKNNTANNIYRLLNSNGKIFSEVLNSVVKFSDEDRSKYANVMSVPTLSEQIERWQSAFRDAQFKEIRVTTQKKKFTRPKDEQQSLNVFSFCVIFLYFSFIFRIPADVCECAQTVFA